MPYSVPGVAAPPPPTPAHGHHNAHEHAQAHSPGRPGHRRSYTFDEETRGAGAFSSLGSLPRRTPPRSPNQKRFHFRADDDESSSSSDEQTVPIMPAWSPAPTTDDDDGSLPPLRLRAKLTPPTRNSPPRSPQRSPNSSFIGSPQLTPNAVPFPRSSSPLSPLPSPATATRPALPGRANSHPVILLANGKPLKSSLKSSRSAPHVPSHHLRARSAPSTPSLSPPTPGTPGASSDAEEGDHDPAAFAEALGLEYDAPSPSTPKAVHFPPPEEGLESVRVFKRTARPASVSFPLSSDDNETETETETDTGMRWVSSMTTQRDSGRRAVSSPLNPTKTMQDKGDEWRYVLDAPLIPRSRDASSMVMLENVWLEGYGSETPAAPVFSQTGPPPSSSTELHLRGTLLVRNAAFEKHVYVRFTLDGWCTTSEVGAKYTDSLPADSQTPGPGWDRFSFTVRLTDYAPRRGLVGRELVMVARFFVPWVEYGSVAPYVWADSLASTTTSGPRPWIGAGGGGQGEWWDNNGGRNYAFSFKAEAKPIQSNQAQTLPRPGPPPTDVLPAVPGANIIPFPTVVAPSPPSTTPSSKPPALTLPIPPPPPPRTAHAQALAAKLGRLGGLRNYAAPVPRPSSWAGITTLPAALSPDKEKEKADKSDDSTPKHTPPTTANPTTGVLGSVGLYWPWGNSRAAEPAAAVNADEKEKHVEDSASNSSDSDGGSDLGDGDGEKKVEPEDTPPTSPLGASGLLALLEEEQPVDDATKPATPMPTPVDDTPTSTLPNGNANPMANILSPPTGAETSSSLYQAFVRQWCFAGAGAGAGAAAAAGTEPKA
ncbi:CBM21 domain-containing protein [Mycena chlorophos]|uniref:CBM21 domain-containing protein n=1 Tax=Mycena chlorophos TaxID=658473 RepID=A0A8H6SR29_MYCCL|nr:CBM21 domain-containing protein [Mycena chlorophos]